VTYVSGLESGDTAPGMDFVDLPVHGIGPRKLRWGGRTPFGMGPPGSSGNSQVKDGSLVSFLHGIYLRRGDLARFQKNPASSPGSTGCQTAGRTVPAPPGGMPGRRLTTDVSNRRETTTPLEHRVVSCPSSRLKLSTATGKLSLFETLLDSGPRKRSKS